MSEVTKCVSMIYSASHGCICYIPQFARTKRYIYDAFYIIFQILKPGVSVAIFTISQFFALCKMASHKYRLIATEEKSNHLHFSTFYCQISIQLCVFIALC